MPRNLKLGPISNSSLRLTWQAPDKSKWDGELLGYQIGYGKAQGLYSRTAEPSFDESLCTEENCSFELKNLDAFTEYSVGINAFNSGGAIGPRGDIVNQTTGEGTPDTAPEHLKCKSISSEEIQVSWENIPLESLHGKFKSYKVTYSPQDHLSNEEKIEYEIATANETVLHGLKKYTNYSINVLVSNSVRDGIESETIYCSTEEDGKYICDFNNLNKILKFFFTISSS